MTLPLRLAVLAAACLVAGGCAPKGCRTDRSSGLSAADLPDAAPGPGVIAGVVRFEGTPPTMDRIDAATPCGGEVFEEWAVVGEDGALANVVVFVDDARPSHGRDREVAVLDQVGCRFVPHVLAVQVGQELEMRSSDAVIHNVHYRPARNPAANFSLENATRIERKTFDFAEPRPVRVRCDVHPWMTAYVAVFDHPLFAVTDSAGRFHIAGVPVGNYTLRAWHERLGIREYAVHVSDATASVEAAFVYAAP